MMEGGVAARDVGVSHSEGKKGITHPWWGKGPSLTEEEELSVMHGGGAACGGVGGGGLP